LNEFIQSLAKLDPIWIYAAIFFISFVENIFPPSPSDVVVVFGGALAGLGKGSYLIALISGASGSTLGFMTAYSIGRWFGRSIIERGKARFLPAESIRKAEDWFLKYGDWIIVANRFLAGTRAVISIFAGMAKTDFLKTTVLSFISSLAWYGLLVYAGYSLGHHWHRIYDYLYTYSAIVMGLILVALSAVIIRHFILRNRQKRDNA